MSRLTLLLRAFTAACAAASLVLSVRTAHRFSSLKESASIPAPAVPASPEPSNAQELERLRAESRELLERARAIPVKGPSGEDTLTTGQLKTLVEDAFVRREREALHRRLVDAHPETQKENRKLVDTWKSAAGPAPNQEARWEEAVQGLDGSTRLAAEEALDVADYHRRIQDARAEAERSIETWLTPDQKEKTARVKVSNGPR